MTGATPSNEPRHVPVLPVEVLMHLELQKGDVVVDATVGGGGHSRLILEQIGPSGRLIGLDRDETMLAMARERLKHFADANFELVNVSFGRIGEVLEDLAIRDVDAVFADVGVSSDQLDSAERGFSFQQDGPLDMRMNPNIGETAQSLVHELNERELADVFWKYGDERFSRRIARRIVENRRRQPIKTTHELAEIVRRSVPRPKGYRRTIIDPATRVFQALRIAVNDELGELERLLAALPKCLKPGGRAAVISFHSHEDRLVKQAFRDRDVWETLTRKPVQAGPDEIQDNPRARSAKLRAARRRRNS